MKVADRLVSEINKTRLTPLSEAKTNILKAVMISGFLNFREIRKEILPSKDRSNAHRLVRELVGAGLLQALSVCGVRTLGWSLSHHKVAQFARDIGFPSPSHYRFVARSDEHDSKVRQVARLLDRVLDVEWIAHEALIRGRQMSESSKFRPNDVSVPDLLVRLNSNRIGQNIAVEVELTRKNNSRIDRILENRLTSPDWDQVIYLLSNDLNPKVFYSRIHHLKVTSSKLSGRKKINPILFFRLNEFLEKGIEVHGTDSQESAISLKNALKVV